MNLLKVATALALLAAVAALVLYASKLAAQDPGPLRIRISCESGVCAVPQAMLERLLKDAAAANEYARLCKWGKP